MKNNLKLLGILLLFFMNSCKKDEDTKLKFNPENFKIQKVVVGGKTLKVRAYENIVYVKNPVDITYQKMNIYIPEEYFQGKSINGFTADSAPIFFPNQVGGYMPGNPGTTTNSGMMPMMPMPQGKMPKDSSKEISKDKMPLGEMSDKPNTIAIALSKGFVVASPGARGRTLVTGKAPAVIIDLKSAVRYLRYNDKNMPGDAEKIISNGTSAGGAVSVLLGATGNAKEYEPYFKEIGSANTRDDVFAISAYCPISNLDNADMAYEWQFNEINNFKKIDISMLDYKVQRKEVAGTMNANQQKISAQLKAMFPAYVNSLQLKDKNGKILMLDEKGNGNFKELVKSYVIASANKAMSYGTDMKKYTFLKIIKGKVIDIDFSAYVRYMERQKLPPAFDALDLSSGENQLFGDKTVDKKHFTKFSFENSIAKGQLADENIVKMMNPMYFIGKQGVDVSKSWRIRHGTKDKDTGLAISVMLATLLQNKGCEVDFALPWDKTHSGDYDLDELFAWMKEISK